LLALLILGERIPARALVATAAVVAGVALLSWRGGTLMRRALWLPVAGAALRGLVQVVAKAGLTLWPSPFAASLIGYSVSSVTVTLAARGRQRWRERSALLWFMATGLLNGLAVLLMYAALSAAAVSLVAPVVAGYPLVTVMLGAAVLREEALSVRTVAGALLIVGGIAYLVAGS
jgi:drug/metabolite transporter (DMT)-like permease